jgi:hypothetical protein
MFGSGLRLAARGVQAWGGPAPGLLLYGGFATVLPVPKRGFPSVTPTFEIAQGALA